jgi:dihydrofolate reductase
MSTILYATTREGYFCKKDSIDGLVDDLSWMRIPTDRKLFKQLTTLHAKQVLIAGYKTVRTLPPLPGRVLVSISTARTRGIELKNALQRYPESIVIGGASVIKSCMHFAHRDFVNSVMTVRLPIKINPKEDASNFVIDPLEEYKNNGILKLDMQFFMHTDNFEHPTVLLEIWRPTYARDTD